MKQATRKSTKPTAPKAAKPGRGHPLSEEVKATIIAHLLAGETGSRIAKELGVGRTVVYNIKNTIREQLAVLEAERREEIADNLFATIVDTQEALRAMLRVMSNETYLFKQPAESIAVLYGVTFDKGVRLLESLAPVEEDTSSNPVSADEPA